jgi:hypothetical protein
MKISDLLRSVADSIDEKADVDVDLDSLEGQTEETEELTDAMVPPLQQELEMKKRSMGVTNAYDRGQVGESVDELALLKKLTGLK